MSVSQSQPECAATPATSQSEPSAAFTPGPWVLEIGDRTHWYVSVDGGDELNVHYRYCTGGVAQYLREQANARLIAAAPDLLEALRPFARFLDALEQMGGNSPKTGVFYGMESSKTGLREITVEDFKAARAAIARALGTSAASPAERPAMPRDTDNSDATGAAK